MILAVGACTAALNAWLDVYGIYRDTHQRRLKVYGNERLAKYLLSVRYVPENFNALLVGSSVSGNWNVAEALPGLRVYNESLTGGNIIEEKCLLDQALARPGVEVVFLVVHPFLTHSHEFESIQLTPRLKLSSLGSQSLWNVYVEMLKIRFHWARQTYNEFGAVDYGAAKHGLNPELKQLMRPGTDFEVDPIAFQTYLDVIQEIRAHGVRIVFVVPPVAEDLLQGKRAAFEKYLRLIQARLAPGEELIDFTSSPYAGFRANGDHFIDGVHIEGVAAEEVVSMLHSAMAQSGSRRLRQQAAAQGQTGGPSGPSVKLGHHGAASDFVKGVENGEKTASETVRFDVVPDSSGPAGAFRR
jgi:hypothetical protein